MELHDVHIVPLKELHKQVKELLVKTIELNNNLNHLINEHETTEAKHTKLGEPD